MSTIIGIPFWVGLVIGALLALLLVAVFGGG